MKRWLLSLSISTVYITLAILVIDINQKASTHSLFSGLPDQSLQQNQSFGYSLPNVDDHMGYMTQGPPLPGYPMMGPLNFPNSNGNNSQPSGMGDSVYSV